MAEKKNIYVVIFLSFVIFKCIDVMYLCAEA